MDDIIKTLDIPASKLALTRYLYIKVEVYLALLVSILQKKESSLFWVYELFYSGYKNELFTFIFKIYYDFFASLNPSFEHYLVKKYRIYHILNEHEQAYLIGSIINTLLFRPFNTDMFFLRIICELFEQEVNYYTPKITNNHECKQNIQHWIEDDDYR